MASSAPRNHWWHVPLYVDVRGLTTRRLHAANGTTFQIDFDFVDHRLVVRTTAGDVESFALRDGLSVAAFDRQLHELLRGPRRRRGDPRGAVRRADDDAVSPTTTSIARTTPRRSCASGGSSTGPIRCSRSSPGGTAARPARCISSGTRSTWRSRASAAGGHRRCPTRTRSAARRTRTRSCRSASGPATGRLREPAYYSYTAPEPPGLRRRPLDPPAARWADQGNGSLALLPYDGRSGGTRAARRPCSRSSRARIGPEPASSAGMRESFARRGARRPAYDRRR